MMHLCTVVKQLAPHSQATTLNVTHTILSIIILIEFIIIMIYNIII